MKLVSNKLVSIGNYLCDFIRKKDCVGRNLYYCIFYEKSLESVNFEKL